MKALGITVTVLILIVILYFAYKYFFPSTTSAAIVSSNTPVTTPTPVHLVVGTPIALGGVPVTNVVHQQHNTNPSRIVKGKYQKVLKP